MSQTRLLYAYDPLCGWCYGLIPALRRVTEACPDLPIEVHPGGLFVGDRAQPYGHLVAHIESAQRRLKATTGRMPGPAFHQMIRRPDAPLSDSTPPSQAVLQMRRVAPNRVLEFAHRLQEVHYERGWDLNAAHTYVQMSKEFGFPVLDLEAITAASVSDEDIAASYAFVRQLGVRSYPTLLVVDGTRVLNVIQGQYDPAGLLSAVAEWC